MRTSYRHFVGAFLLLALIHGATAAWADEGAPSAPHRGNPSDQRCGTLAANQGLTANSDHESLYSCNDNYRLTLQADGNLVIYNITYKTRPRAIWASHTAGKKINRALVLAEGTFGLYTAADQLAWSSGAPGSPGTYLRMQDDGNLVLYSASGEALWASRTAVPIPYVSALSFGAIGDGVTDNQEALQSAFDYAKSAGVGVAIPAGVYRHSGELTVDGIVVFGAHNDQTILMATTHGSGAIQVTGANPALYNLMIRGPGGPRTSDRPGNGIYIVRSTGYVIENCHVKGTSGAGIMTEFGVGGKILHNFVESTGADGIYSTEATSDLEVAFNRTHATGDDAISFTSWKLDGSGEVHDVNVHDNRVTGNTGSRSITVNGGYNIIIQNNFVDGGTAGISVGAASTGWHSRQNHDITVTNNIVKNTTYTGEGTIGGGALHLYNNAGGRDYNITFSNNDVYGPAHYGIFVWGTSQIQAVLSGNRVYADDSHPLFVNRDLGATEISLSHNMKLRPWSYSPVPNSAISSSGLDPKLPLPVAW